MNRQRQTWLGISLMVAVLLTGCAQPPVQQLEADPKAVEAARTAGASDYAKEDFVQLEQAFGQAKDELVNQEKTFTIFRSYRTAERMLKRIVEDAKRVEDTATLRKDEARAAALKSEKEAQTVLASVQKLLAVAPVGKDRAAVESIKNDLHGLLGSLEAIHQLIEQGDYLGAEAKGIKKKSEAVSSEIQNAIPKARGGKLRRA